MKKLNLRLVFIIVLSLLINSCGENKEIIEVEKIMSPELIAKFHNESITSLIGNEKDAKKFNSSITIREMLKIMSKNMEAKYPEYFKNINVEKASIFLDLDLKVNDFGKNELDILYSKMKKEAIKSGIDKEIINHIDEKIISNGKSNNNLSKKENSKYNIEVFNSVLISSKELWTKKVPKKYLINNENILAKQGRGCDPVGQIIIADSAGTFFGSALLGPFGSLVGGGVSLLVRSGQTKNSTSAHCI